MWFTDLLSRLITDFSGSSKHQKMLGPMFFSISSKSKWVTEISPIVFNFPWGVQPGSPSVVEIFERHGRYVILSQRISLGIWNCSQSFILSSLGLPGPHVVTRCPRDTRSLFPIGFTLGPVKRFSNAWISFLIRFQPIVYRKIQWKLVDGNFNYFTINT